jgi:hypothetical protein
MYVNNSAIDGQPSGYWSSSEGAATNGWRQNFGDGNQSNGSKTDTIFVRPVRAF